MLMMTGLDGWHGGVNEIARIKLDYLSQCNRIRRPLCFLPFGWAGEREERLINCRIMTLTLNKYK